MSKNDYIGVRVTPQERREYELERVKKGYRNLTDFVLTVLRKFHKRVPKERLK